MGFLGEHFREVFGEVAELFQWFPSCPNRCCLADSWSAEIVEKVPIVRIEPKEFDDPDAHAVECTDDLLGQGAGVDMVEQLPSLSDPVHAPTHVSLGHDGPRMIVHGHDEPAESIISSEAHEEIVQFEYEDMSEEFMGLPDSPPAQPQSSIAGSPGMHHPNHDAIDATTVGKHVTFARGWTKPINDATTKVPVAKAKTLRLPPNRRKRPTSPNARGNGNEIGQGFLLDWDLLPNPKR